MTSLKTRIATLGRHPSPARPVAGPGGRPVPIDGNAYKYTTGADGAELVPLTGLITADGAMVAAQGPAGPDTLAPAGRP